MLNRLVFFLSLVGMILTIHLWIQKERDFDRGCWGVGVSSVQPESELGCNSHQLQKVSEFLGVSIAAWGYGFYFFVAAMAFGKIVLPERTATACHTASDIAIALAVPYTGYLVYYQAAVAKAFCPLCLVSASVIGLLAALHAYQYWRGGFTAVSPSQRSIEMGYAAGMGFVAAGLLVAMLVFIDRVGTRRFDEGSHAKEFTTMVGRSLPEFIDIARLQEMKPARFDFELPRLAVETWIDGDVPVLGTRGQVNVLIFLDPNCPSCRGTFAMVRSLAERYGEQVGFYVFSRVLWDISLLQSQALELAKQTGKYFDLWELQLRHQKRGGLGVRELEPLFVELGMNPANLSERLRETQPAAVALRERAHAAGIDSTPSIYINGQAVHARSRDESGLRKLIERAIADSKENPTPAPAVAR